VSVAGPAATASVAPAATVSIAGPAPTVTAAVARSLESTDEVAAEDVVTLEPPPARPVVSVVPPMRPRLASQPSVPPPSPSKRPVQAPAPSLSPAPSAAPPRPALVIVPPHVGNMPTPQAEAIGQKRKPRLWWEDLFNDDYLRTPEKITDSQIAREVAFIEDSLGVERGGALLDLACGTGRHAIDLARRGYEVVGFDLSLAMLARAGDEAQDRAAKLNFIQGDMREMTFDEQFDGVYCWNTSFGYFEEEKNAQVVDRVHRALKAGGQFLLDVVNRDFLIRQSPSLAWFEGDGCVCMDEMSVDFITSRMKVKRTMMLDDGRSREIEYSMRVYSLHELGRILHEHGFKVREVSGRLATPGVFFGNESPRAIILAEKR
jgi:SAM-dependent methyltransferase